MQRSLPLLSGFANMIDLGGNKVSSTGLSASANLLADSIGKNNKLIGVLFDFDTVSSTNRAPPKPSIQDAGDRPTTTTSLATTYKPPDLVLDMANLLGVDISGPTVSLKKPIEVDDRDDDLSMLGEVRLPASPPAFASNLFEAASLKPADPSLKAAVADSETLTRMQHNSDPSSGLGARSDPRLKYAALLAKKGAGLAKLENMKMQQQEFGGKSDASFHVGIRDALKKKEENNPLKASSWLVSAGMGSVHMYMQTRSMKIGLITSTPSNFKHLSTYTSQLNNIRFHYKQPTDSILIADVLAAAQKEMKVDRPSQIMVVSSAEATLKAARDLGLFTCRVVVPNGRRGITCNFSVDGVTKLGGIVDEINGISFKSVRSIRDSKIDHK